jgi:uncharacterized protein
VLQLNVARLKRSPGDTARYDLTAELPALELQDESMRFSGPVKAGLDVDNTGPVLAVKGEVSGKLTLTCGRCLEPFEYSFDVPVEETYAPDTGGEKGEAVPFSGDILDITPEVLKSIILALPMKAVCREDCRGLCPKCGKNLNEGRCDCESEDIDPRFSVLKDLFKEK